MTGFYRTWSVVISGLTMFQGFPFQLLNHFSLASSLLWNLLQTKRAALRWTFSYVRDIFLDICKGPHTGEQYSRMGLTSPLYAVSLTWVVFIRRFLRRNATCLLALSQVLLMWLAQLRSLESWTPSIGGLIYSLQSLVVQFILVQYLNLCFLVMAILLHFAALNDMHHCFSQTSPWLSLTSSCKMAQSSSDFTALYTTQSSAKQCERLICTSYLGLWSLMRCEEEKMGLSTVALGITPAFNWNPSISDCLTIHHGLLCVLPTRKDFIHASSLSPLSAIVIWKWSFGDELDRSCIQC